MIKKILLLLATTQLGACAVMSKSECLSADWKQVGYHVGTNGDDKSGAAFSKRQKVCAKHGAVADWKNFKLGHAIGIDQYCHVDNSVLLGIRGASNAIENGVCPEAEYPGFRDGFNAGYRLHRLESDLYDAKSSLSSLESRKYDYRRELKRIRKKLKSDELNAEQRNSMEKRCDYINHRIYELRDRIDHYEYKVIYRRDEANDYESFLRLEYAESFNYQYQPPL